MSEEKIQLNKQSVDLSDFFELAKSSIPNWLENNLENVILKTNSWDNLTNESENEEEMNDKITQVIQSLEDSGVKRESSDDENLGTNSSQSDCCSEDSGLNNSSFPNFKDLLLENESDTTFNRKFYQAISYNNNFSYEDILNGLCKFTNILLEEDNYYIPEIDLQSENKSSYFLEKIGTIFQLDDSKISVCLEHSYNELKKENVDQMPKYKVVKSLNSTHIIIKKVDGSKAFPLEIVEAKRGYYILKKNNGKSIEKNMLNYFKHPNIVEFFGSYRNITLIDHVMEYLPCGNFISLIQFISGNREVKSYFRALKNKF